MKASGRMAHGSGNKLTSDSPQYRIVKRWIEQATPMVAKRRGRCQVRCCRANG